MCTRRVQRSRGDLFGKPDKRPKKRGWTELDRLRARVEQLNKRIEDTGGDEKDLEACDDATMRLIRAEEEAKGKWKNSFGS